MKRNLEIRKCKICNNSFIIERWKPTNCCSKSCSYEYSALINNETRICSICGSEFIIRKHAKSQFCSPECRVKFNNIHGLDSKNNTSKKICLNCGKDFLVWNYRKDIANFCSPECHYSYKRVINTCIECGNEYEIAKWEKDGPINALCPKCRNKSDKKRPLRKSAFETNVISMLKNKLPHKNIIDYSKVKLNRFVIFPDIMIDNNVIECQGDYWHCNPLMYDAEYYHSRRHLTAQQIWEYDKTRENQLIKAGYNVFYLWEEDFYKNKELSINKLIEKINEIN